MTINTVSLMEKRSDSYRLLSECFYPPDEKFLSEFNSTKKRSAGLCSQIANAAPPINELNLLQLDHAKLFIGPYKMLAPPYGSVYLENRQKLMDNSTIDVMTRYEQEGLNLNLKDAPDHISAELEFMYFLICQEAEASINFNLENVEIYKVKQQEFWNAHLSLWVFEFAKKIEKHANSEFYKKLGLLTKVFFSSEVEYFNS